MTKPKSGRWQWLKWWPKRWRGDTSVQACSLAARGAWNEILNVMALGDSGGFFLIGGEVPTDEEVARLLGCSVREWKACEVELDRRKVWSRRELDGAIYCRSRVREEEPDGEPDLRSEDGEGVPQGSPEGDPVDTPKGTPREPEGRPPSRALSPLSSSSSEGGGRGGGRKREAGAEQITHAFKATPVLDTPDCRAAWDRWMRHRREIGKPVTPTSAADAIAGYAKRGPQAFLEAIAHTIARGWQGLRDPSPEDRAGLAQVTRKASAETPEQSDLRQRWQTLWARRVRDGKARGIPDWPGFEQAHRDLSEKATVNA